MYLFVTVSTSMLLFVYFLKRSIQVHVTPSSALEVFWLAPYRPQENDNMHIWHSQSLKAIMAPMPLPHYLVITSPPNIEDIKISLVLEEIGKIHYSVKFS